MRAIASACADCWLWLAREIASDVPPLPPAFFCPSLPPDSRGSAGSAFLAPPRAAASRPSSGVKNRLFPSPPLPPTKSASGWLFCPLYRITSKHYGYRPPPPQARPNNLPEAGGFPASRCYNSLVNQDHTGLGPIIAPLSPFLHGA